MTHATDQTFEEEVIKSQVPVMVDFWAEWCGPCHAIAPHLEELDKLYKGKFKIVKLNVDLNPATSMKYNIMSIPNMKIFKDGTVVDEIVGAVPRQVIEDRIKSHIND